jgi:hypothetical protein
MVVEKRRTVELRRDGGWMIQRRRAVRSSLGPWLNAKGRGVDGGRTQSLGAGVGADFAGTTHVAVGGFYLTGLGLSIKSPYPFLYLHLRWSHSLLFAVGRVVGHATGGTFCMAWCVSRFFLPLSKGFDRAQ